MFDQHILKLQTDKQNDAVVRRTSCRLISRIHTLELDQDEKG